LLGDDPRRAPSQSAAQQKSGAKAPLPRLSGFAAGSSAVGEIVSTSAFYRWNVTVMRQALLSLIPLG
jgi:hypothetical protein